MSEERLQLMDLFRRDMSGIETTTVRHNDDLHPAFKGQPLVFKYEYSTFLFKVWKAGRDGAGVKP